MKFLKFSCSYHWPIVMHVGFLNSFNCELQVLLQYWWGIESWLLKFYILFICVLLCMFVYCHTFIAQRRQEDILKLTKFMKINHLMLFLVKVKEITSARWYFHYSLCVYSQRFYFESFKYCKHKYTLEELNLVFI